MSNELKGRAIKQLKLPTVDYSNTPARYINAQRGDTNARYVEIQLFDDRGIIDLTPYTIDVALFATLPDGTKQKSCGLVTEDNVVVFKLTSGILSQAGAVACSVYFLGRDEEEEENISLTSQTFYVIVAESHISIENIAEDNNYDLLLKLLTELSEFYEKTKETEDKREIAEEARITAEEERQINELGEELDGSGGRVGAETKRIELYEKMKGMLDGVLELPTSIKLMNGEDEQSVFELIFVNDALPVEDD